ncbi:hypothetical protein LTR78_006751 [Recurvomyces mirabilis]|uniref:Transcription factor domain-containing protein n=1 Tax=Recurvomyces mirabilis TaxID=574656 RepID=A0AAE0WKQ2_9PEZI|nr:hypothetical protein LTR78_006751 [Recurvomyces mirabilis]
MDSVSTTSLLAGQSLSATFGHHTRYNGEAGTVPESTLESNFDPNDESFFAPTAVGDTSNELDLFDFTETMEGTGFWSMAATDTQFWFDGSDTLSEFLLLDVPSTTDYQDMAHSTRSLSSKMQDWFSATSRSSSPSRNRIRKMWYSGMPDPDHYKKEVKEVFLRLFMKHIPHSFPLFDRKHSSEHERPVMYVLAMAAVGGLFCSVPGSGEVARSMCNDARRLVLAAYTARNLVDPGSDTVESRLVSVKTMILLGIYGICSGDKRSYEFYEAFYADMSHAVEEFASSLEEGDNFVAWDSQVACLVGALYILDSYRVTIMLRPPLLPWWGIESLLASSTPKRELSVLLSRAQHLWRMHPPIKDLSSDPPGLAILCSFAPHVWRIMYAQHNADAGEDMLLSTREMGHPSFAEMACDHWLHAQPDTVQSSHLAVYHMMNIILHANVKTLQTFAHSPSDSHTRDQKRSMVAREVHRWAHDRDCKNAEWHARRLMAVIEMSVMHWSPGNTLGKETSSSQGIPTPETYESPHVPYAVYFAAIILWCIGVVGEKAVTETELRAPIIRAERLLLLHKMHVAKNLIRALRSIS